MAGGYRIGDKVKTKAQIRAEAYRLAEGMSPETKKAFLDSLSNTFGIEDQVENKKETFTRIWGPIIGVVLLLACVVIAFLRPNPTRFQYGAFWMLESAGMAFSFVLMSGWIEFKHEGVIKAGGGAAIWAIMYFFLPAIMAQQPGRVLKMTLNVVPADTSQVQSFQVDFDSTSREDVCAFACHSIEHYMGGHVAAGDFVCYRFSDGLIYTNTSCGDISEYRIIMIATPVTDKYGNKRLAYQHFWGMFSQ
jgi:hypothetical protein